MPPLPEDGSIVEFLAVVIAAFLLGIASAPCGLALGLPAALIAVGGFAGCGALAGTAAAVLRRKRGDVTTDAVSDAATLAHVTAHSGSPDVTQATESTYFQGCFDSERGILRWILTQRGVTLSQSNDHDCGEPVCD